MPASTPETGLHSLRYSLYTAKYNQQCRSSNSKLLLGSQIACSPLCVYSFYIPEAVGWQHEDA